MGKKLSKKIKILSILLAAITVVGVVASILIANNSFGRIIKKASKNLTSYAINATYDADNTLSAEQTIEYINKTGDSLENICLHLYPRAFRNGATILPYTSLNKASCFPNGTSYGDISVSKVDINGESANFEFVGEDSDILRINLYKNLENKAKITIDINFELTIPNCTHRFGYYNGMVNLGNWYPIICVYKNGEWNTTPYYSTGDPFVSECSNYSVNIKYPNDYSCYGTGEQSVNNNTSTFKALAVRDVALVLTNKSQCSQAQSGNTQVTYVGYAQDADIENNAKISAQAVDYFSETFGRYPYSSLVVVKSAFLHGGMEYPNIVIVSDNISETEEFNKVIVHEIAHQWWYGVVGSDQINSAWMDESLAEYSTCLFFEQFDEYNIDYGEQIMDATASYLLYVDVISSLNGKVNTRMNCAVNEYGNEYEYTYMIYVKGVIMFDSLREAIGKNKFEKALNKYYKKYAFKIATEENFIDCFNSVCNNNVTSFFSGWLEGTNVVGYID